MISLQSLMLIALGFLMASLLFIALSTAYRNRVVRLTTEEIRRSIPITEAEIRADKDRLRAQFAIRVHKLESQGEQQRLSAARQRIEMNRRDARIAELETELEALRASLEENVNARRVLEHTVTDRLPRLEYQLDGARGLIQARDQEMAALKSETTRSVRALDEAMQISAQQRSELERMKLAGSRQTDRDAGGAGRFDADFGLRQELEILRTRTREQAQLIARLQDAALVPTGSGAAAAPSEPRADRQDVAGELRVELATTMAALEAAREALDAGRMEAEAAGNRHLEMQGRLDEQGAELARLTAALTAYEDADGTAQAGSSKARVNSLQAQLVAQNETILKLRSELAGSNERLARQAAHYVDQMRKMGTGLVPTTVKSGRGRALSQQAGPASALSPTRISGADSQADGMGRDAANRRPKGKAAALSRRLITDQAQGPTSSKVAAYLKALATGVRGENANDGAGPKPDSDLGPDSELDPDSAQGPGSGERDMSAPSGNSRTELSPEPERTAISALVRAVGGGAAGPESTDVGLSSDSGQRQVGVDAAAAERAGRQTEAAAGSAPAKPRLLDRISGIGKG